jgi:hypothetical protein
MNIQESFPSKYIKAADLKGRAVPVTIDRVEMEQVGQARDMKPVLYFDGKEKGMVLNKTNANAIIHITQSPVTEEWAGHRILLYPTETSYQGEQVDCVRVKAVPAAAARAVAPPPPPPLEYVAPITDDDMPGGLCARHRRPALSCELPGMRT